MRLTLDDRIPNGGFAVPMATVIQHLPELRSTFDRPPPAASEWIEKLGARILKEAGRGPDGVRWEAEVVPVGHIDIEVSLNSRPPGGWRVSAFTTPANQVDVGVAELGDDVMDAVQRWSQRRTFGGLQEDKLLGKVLYRALLPPPVEEVIEREMAKNAPVLVRVRVSGTNELAAIPWEYARKDDDASPLSTRVGTPFSRFVDIPSKPVALAERLRVLGMVQTPKAIYRPTFFGSEGGIKPETAQDLKKGFEKTLGGKGRIDHRVLIDADFKTIEADQTGDHWHVIHYLGHAWDDGKLLAVVGSSGYRPVGLDVFIRAVAAMQPTVVVLQLLPAPSERPSPALGLATALKLLDGSIQAVVVAQHAASDRHIASFNERFYGALADGESVELAVTRGREELLSSPPYEDSTAFGTVSVTTTHSGDLRLVTAPVPRSNQDLSSGIAGRPAVRGRAHGPNDA
jgi:hypothetical protein